MSRIEHVISNKQDYIARALYLAPCPDISRHQIFTEFGILTYTSHCSLSELSEYPFLYVANEYYSFPVRVGKFGNIHPADKATMIICKTKSDESDEYKFYKLNEKRLAMQFMFDNLSDIIDVQEYINEQVR